MASVELGGFKDVEHGGFNLELGGELGGFKNVELNGEEKEEKEETEEEKELRDPTFRLRWTQDHLCQ